MSQGSSKTILEEKNDIEGRHENASAIDLTRYHEQLVGRLVLDPEFVYFLFLFSSSSLLKQRGAHRVW